MEKGRIERSSNCCKAVYAVFSIIARNAHKIGICFFLITASCNFSKLKSFNVSNNGVSAELIQKSEKLTENFANLNYAIQKRDAIGKQINDALLGNCGTTIARKDQIRNTGFAEFDKLQKQQNRYDDQIKELVQQTKQSLEGFKNAIRNVSK